MTDRPIIFSAAMVRALLSGRKTQTRRLATSPLRRVEIGDRLYVRENCCAEELSRPQMKRLATPKERAHLGRTHVLECDEMDGADGVRYLADGAWLKIENTMAAGEAWGELFYYRGRGKDRVGNPVPAIHMPRWASRLTLIVEGVKVEPLQAISGQDAWAEGICVAVEDSERTKFGDVSVNDRRGIVRAIFGDGTTAYRWLWDSLHTKKGDRWEDNPEVVALTFRVVRGNIDQVSA